MNEGDVHWSLFGLPSFYSEIAVSTATFYYSQTVNKKEHFSSFIMQLGTNKGKDSV